MAASLTPRYGAHLDVPMTAEEVMANPFVCVKLGTAAGSIVIAGDGDVVFGILQEPAAAVGAEVRVRPLGASESFVRANGAFSKGDQLKAAATDGEVDTTTSGEAIGVALEDATAAGDLVVAQLYHNKL